MTGMSSIVADRERVLIHQTKEWGEILLGFESKNRFELRDERGGKIGFAAEEAKGVGQWFLRNLFGRCRRAKVHVYDRDGRKVGRGEKPFRWYFHRMEIFDGEQRIGAVQRKFAWLRAVFAIENATGQEVLQLRSGLFRYWHFRVSFEGREVGAIRKQWGGLLKEMFTDADTFGLEVQPHVPVEVRAMLLITTFLVDFTCFENNKGSSSLLDVDFS